MLPKDQRGVKQTQIKTPSAAFQMSAGGSPPSAPNHVFQGERRSPASTSRQGRLPVPKSSAPQGHPPRRFPLIKQDKERHSRTPTPKACARASMSVAGETSTHSASPEPSPLFGDDQSQEHDGLHTATTSMSSTLESPAGSAVGQIDNFDWKDLEQRFASRMSEFENEEAKIYEDFNDWLKLFQAWASTTTAHENERAMKRLRTRMHFVQGSEAKLEEKREHHQKVVEAFESALKLMEGHS